MGDRRRKLGDGLRGMEGGQRTPEETPRKPRGCPEDAPKKHRRGPKAAPKMPRGNPEEDPKHKSRGNPNGTRGVPPTMNLEFDDERGRRKFDPTPANFNYNRHERSSRENQHNYTGDKRKLNNLRPRLRVNAGVHAKTSTADSKLSTETTRNDSGAPRAILAI